MCGVGLDPETSVGHSVRQVFDLPEPAPLVVTEHRAHDCQCAACGAKMRALFPDGVNAPVQYGAKITALVIYLLHYQLLPENLACPHRWPISSVSRWPPRRSRE